MSDFYADTKAAKKAIDTARQKVSNALEALTAAQTAETAAWAGLYQVPGVVAPETAVAVTGIDLATCKEQYDAVKKAKLLGGQA